MDFLCNCSSDRKKLIFPGRYLKADHFEMLRGRGGLKTMNVKPFIDWGRGYFFFKYL